MGARTGTSTNIGLFSLVDHLADPTTGQATSPGQRLVEVVEQGVLAERVGFERFAVGEHHFCDYILPNPNLVLAAVAARTRTLRLFTTVTLIALHDTIQLAEDIAVLDNLSSGRFELSIARGVSAETLQAFDVQGDTIYETVRTKLGELLALLSSGEITTSQGTALRLRPRPAQRPHPPLWIGGGLSTESCDIAIERGLPLILPSLFRYPEDYLPMLERYRERMQALGKADRIRVGLPSYCWVAKTSQLARERWRPRIEHYVDRFKELRKGFGRPMDFDGLVRGPAICGSPAEVTDRLSQINEQLGLDTHILLMDAGGVPYDELREGLELMGRDVLPHFAAASDALPQSSAQRTGREAAG